MSAIPQLDVGEDAGVEMVSPLISARHLHLPANGNACCFSADGERCAVALGDGTIAIIDGISSALDGDESTPLQTVFYPRHRVAAVAVRFLRGGFVTAGQDGTVIYAPVADPSDARPLWQSDGDWIEALVVHEGRGLAAFAAGRTIVVTDAEGAILREVLLEATVTGLCFDERGKRIAASHYGGVSLIDLESGDIDRRLTWKGAHIGVTWSPCGRYVVTATQEKELHGWDLVTLKDFRMGGYPRKTHQMAWTADGEMLACSGADVVTAWSFAGSGPSGRPPVEIGFVFGAMVSAVAAHPHLNLVAGGFTSGNVLVGATGKGEALVAQARTGHGISGLAWSPCGTRLVAIDRVGAASLFALPASLPVR